MKNYKWIVLIAVLLLSAAAAVAETETSVPEVLPPHSIINGKKLGDWGAEWWQWAYSFNRDYSPVEDDSGRLCSLGQSGDVWFLAGSYTTRPIVRECTVPQGKYLFFPIINFIAHPTPEKPESCRMAAERAARLVEEPGSLFFRINGVEIVSPRSHRESVGKCFDPFAKIDNMTKPTWAYPAASDGYWIALKPLPPGTHILQFGGRLATFEQNITYKIHVLDEKKSPFQKEVALLKKAAGAPGTHPPPRPGHP